MDFLATLKTGRFCAAGFFVSMAVTLDGCSARSRQAERLSPASTTSVLPVIPEDASEQRN